MNEILTNAALAAVATAVIGGLAFLFKKKLNEWNISRRAKRHTRVKYNGKEYPAWKFIEIWSKKLPAMYNSQGVRRDHYNAMKKEYMKHGPDGARKYVDDTLGQLKKQLKRVA